MKNNIGKVRTIFNRARTDATAFQLLMIGYLFVKEAGWHWWYIPVVVLFILYRVYDTRKILGQEWDFIFEKSRIFQELVNDVKQIKSNMAKTK